MRRWFLVLGLWLLFPSAAVADDKAQPPPPPTPAQQADLALAAVEAKDEKALAAIAGTDNPDPWFVADELLSRGEADAADAFAKAAPRRDVRDLPAYVASQRGKRDDPAARQAQAAAIVAFKAKDGKAALAAVTSVKPDVTTLVGVRLVSGRGLAHRLLGEWPAAAAGYHEAAEGARALGWIRREVESVSDEGGAAFSGREYARVVAPTERRLALEKERGYVAGQAAAETTLGAAYNALGQSAKALPYFERALVLRRAVGDRGWIARALGDLGYGNVPAGEYAKAIACHEEALAIWEALEDKASIAKTLAELSALYEHVADTAKALAAAEKALATAEGIGDEVGIAFALDRIATIHAIRGGTIASAPFLERAIETAEGVKDRGAAALLLERLGAPHIERAEYATALAYLERALAICEPRADRTQTARVLSNIGVAHYYSGDFVGALALQTKALAIHEALGNRDGVMGAHLNRALAYDGLGEFPKAIADYERCLEVARAVGDRRAEGMALGDLAGLYHSLGDEKRSLAAHQEHLRICEEIGDTDGLANALLNVGVLREALHEYREAIAVEERALTILEKMGDRVGAAHALLSLSVAHVQLEHGDEALGFAARAIDLARETGNRAKIAGALKTQGDVQDRLGTYRGALESFALARAEAEACGDLEILVEAIAGEAHSHLALKEVQEAIRTSREAVMRMHGLLGGLAEEQASSARSRHFDIYEVGMAAALEADDTAELLYFLEGGRAGALLESLGSKGALRQATLPPDLLAAETSAHARTAAAVSALTRASKSGNAEEIARRKAEVEAGRDAANAVVERMQREAKAAARVIYPVPASIEEIARAVRPGEALVLYATPDPTAVAIVMTRAGSRIVRLGPAKNVQAACEAIHVGTAEPGGAGPREQGSLDALRALVIDPLGLPPDVTRLLISPDGPLNYVPFAALSGKREVVLVPSGTTYILLAEEKSKRGSGVLALGDPAPSGSLGLAALRGEGPLAPLPGTRDEAKAVGDVVLLGAEASEGGLTAALAKRPRWHAVHFACHGIVDPERPTLSALALAPAPGAADDDGWLTALDVFRLSIPADLVVLSACETGKGKIYSGEGIVGLTRAFMYAGAPRVLVSLWKVDDEATRLLMTQFYDLWNKQGLTASAALKKAQEFVRDSEEEAVDPEASRAAGRDVKTKQKRYAEPRYWAGWVLWGLPD